MTVESNEAILINAFESWMNTGRVPDWSGEGSGIVWTEVAQSRSLINHVCAAPAGTASFLRALLESRPEDPSLMAVVKGMAHLFVVRADGCYAEGHLDKASDFYTAALQLMYAHHLRDRAFSYLERVNFEIASVCNLRCKYCNFKSGQRKKYIDKDFYRRVLEELAQKVPHLKRLALYMSGESLMHPDFIGILQVTREIKDRYPAFRPLTYLHTNGMLWTPAMNDRIMAVGALDQVTWSIDGVDAASFEDMRRGAKFGKVMDHFRYFLAHHPPGVTAVVNNIVERNGGDPCPELESLFAGADAVNRLEPKTLNTPVEGAIPTKWQGKHDGFCEYIFHTVVVTTDGRMSLCCVDYNSINAFGDIARDGFEGVYYGPDRAHLLRLMADRRRREINGCRGCQLLRNSWSNDLNRIEKTRGKDGSRMRTLWGRLSVAEGVNKVALFGAGKYTAWLNAALDGVEGPDVTAVLDDDPIGKPIFFGKIVSSASEFDPRSVDAIVLSTDSISQAMRSRCMELYGGRVRIIDLIQDIEFD